MSAPSLGIAVLAYNEEENVEAVLGELRAWIDTHEPEAEILFVDDGSTDGTSEAARRALAGSRHQCIRHETNRGIGAALKSAVRQASSECITFLPADGQIAPSAIGTLREEAALRGCDLVLSVYDHRDDGAHRKVLSWGVRALIWAVHGVRMQSDGPYLFRRRLFDPDGLPPDSFFLNFEFPIRALAKGTSTSTVTIACRPRRAGHSKSTGIRRIVNVARDLIDLRLRRGRERRQRRGSHIDGRA